MHFKNDVAIFLGVANFLKSKPKQNEDSVLGGNSFTIYDFVISFIVCARTVVFMLCYEYRKTMGLNPHFEEYTHWSRPQQQNILTLFLYEIEFILTEQKKI